MQGKSYEVESYEVKSYEVDLWLPRAANGETRSLKLETGSCHCRWKSKADSQKNQIKNSCGLVSLLGLSFRP